MGAPASVIKAALDRKGRSECLVFEDCWQSVMVFLTLGSQWRMVAGMGGAFYQGLDYTAIEPCLRLMGIPKEKWSLIFGQAN